MDENLYEEKKVLPRNTDELKPIEIIDKNEPEILSPIDNEDLLDVISVDDKLKNIIPLNRNKRITFRVTEDVHRKVKILSIYNNMNMQDVMEQLIIEKLVLYESENPGIFSLMD